MGVDEMKKIFKEIRDEQILIQRKNDMFKKQRQTFSANCERLKKFSRPSMNCLKFLIDLNMNIYGCRSIRLTSCQKNENLLR